MGRVFKKATYSPVPAEATISKTSAGLVATWMKAGKSVTAPVKTSKSGKKCIVILSRKWYGTVSGKQIPLCKDKRTAETILTTLEADAVRGQFGVGPSNPSAARLPLRKHLEEFRAAILAGGTSPRHAEHVFARTLRVLEAMGWRVIADLNAEGAARWIASLGATSTPDQLPALPTEYRPGEAARLLGISLQALSKSITRNAHPPGTGNGKARRIPRSTVLALISQKSKGVGPRTRNDYRIHLKHFGRWLEETGRVQRNPFAHGLSAERTECDIRKRRRALTTDELTRLLEATRHGPDRCGLSGYARSLLYSVAFVTGFRRAALADLTPAHFQLGPTPTVTLTATASKNGRSQVNPIPESLAAAIRDYVSTRSEHEPLWPGSWVTQAAKMLRADLRTADIAWKTIGVHGPVVVDFHGLRHTAFTHAARTAPLHVVQQLAGHSSPTVTGKYTHADFDDLRNAVNAMPSVVSGNYLHAICTEFARTGGPEGHHLACPDKNVTDSAIGNAMSKPLVGKAFSNCRTFETTSDTSAPLRTRTLNPLIKSHNDQNLNAFYDKKLGQFPDPICTEFAQNSANLPDLLAQLAALSPEQRQAIVTLLTPPKTADKPPSSNALDDILPAGYEQKGTAHDRRDEGPRSSNQRKPRRPGPANGPS